ncbi:MAG TPA: hypothetical protein VLA82_03175 [Actinomycetota bacterium]|nr:hypothetical protein [Actinomycetota bacterium]
MATVVVATANGIHSLGIDGSSDVALEGKPVTTVARDGDGMWAIVDAAELWRSDGDRWTRAATLTDRRPTCLAIVRGDVLVGTDEAHLLRVVDDEVAPIETFDRVDGRDRWYTPWGGPPATRSIANWTPDTYVNVHVGGILRTGDGGQTWSPTIDIDADVHQVTTAEGLVLAACAGGLAVSTDRGESWSMRTEGLATTYARAVAVWRDQVVLSASRGPRGGDAAVYRAPLDGGAFRRCEAGPGSFDGNIDTYGLDALPEGDVAAFGTASGQLYASTDAGETWTELGTGLPQVRRVLLMP